MTFVISSLPKLIGGFGLIIAATAAVSPPQSAQAQTTLPGEDSSRGLAINDLGEVVGSSTSAVHREITRLSAQSETRWSI